MDQRSWLIFASLCVHTYTLTTIKRCSNFTKYFHKHTDSLTSQETYLLCIKMFYLSFFVTFNFDSTFFLSCHIMLQNKTLISFSIAFFFIYLPALANACLISRVSNWPRSYDSAATIIFVVILMSSCDNSSIPV